MIPSYGDVRTIHREQAQTEREFAHQADDRQAGRADTNRSTHLGCAYVDSSKAARRVDQAFTSARGLQPRVQPCHGFAPSRARASRRAPDVRVRERPAGERAPRRCGGWREPHAGLARAAHHARGARSRHLARPRAARAQVPTTALRSSARLRAPPRQWPARLPASRGPPARRRADRADTGREVLPPSPATTRSLPESPPLRAPAAADGERPAAGAARQGDEQGESLLGAQGEQGVGLGTNRSGSRRPMARLKPTPTTPWTGC